MTETTPRYRIDLRILVRRHANSPYFTAVCLELGCWATDEDTERALDRLEAEIRRRVEFCNREPSMAGSPVLIWHHNRDWCRFSEGRTLDVVASQFASLSPWFTGAEVRIWEPEESQP